MAIIHLSNASVRTTRKVANIDGPAAIHFRSGELIQVPSVEERVSAAWMVGSLRSAWPISLEANLVATG